MSDLDVARLIAEILGILSVLFGGLVLLVSRIKRVHDAVNDVLTAIGDKDRPAVGTVRAQLKHQDECTDKLREKVDAEIKEASRERAKVGERLARIEGKLNIPEVEAVE